MRIAAAARKTRELARRLLAIGDEGRDERARRAQFAPQQRDALVLVRAPVVEARRRRREELGDRALVHVGVLPEIDRREMEAEHVDRAPAASAAARAR